MSLSPDSSFGVPPLDVLSNIASNKSTPPTTIADSASLHSDTSKVDANTIAHDSSRDPVPMEPTQPHDEDADTPSRVRRSRGPKPTYNLAELTGTAGHGKREANGDAVSARNKRRRTVAADRRSWSDSPGATPERKAATKARRVTLDALVFQNSPQTSASPRARRHQQESPRPVRSTRRPATSPSPPASNRTGVSTRRTRKGNDVDMSKVPRELRRLEDTKEFSHVDDRPVVYTVWSKGRYIDPAELKKKEEAKKAKAAQPAEEEVKEGEEPITNTRKRRVKKYLEKGLYAGQDPPIDIAKGLTPGEKKKLGSLPELLPTGRRNKTFPSPLYTGLRTLINGRDFKLPYQICNPMPPGQPKPDEWKKMTKNRFIGESKDIWRKSPHFHDYQSMCVCKPEDGCGESCQNRIMLYECDSTNCNVGEKFCTNRAFSDLTARRNKGGKYRVGVEVIKTSDRGYGVRSNRCFEPGQIIMEYAGEIITEEECDRRMNEVYKDNECYYLMSFDQNMIIDATTGSIARFVNHSCNPNCRMIKWIVSGQPRMALFAGDGHIMTGDELTYDYNFDPFSAKNVQSCLCGEPNCRGVLGPKKREEKPIQKAVKESFKAGKRKLQAMMGGSPAGGNQPKKPRITSTKGALASVGLKIANGTASALKKGMSTVASSAKKAALGAKSPAKRRAQAAAIVKKTSTSRVAKSYVKGTAKKQIAATPTGKNKANAIKRTTVKKTTVKKTPTKAAMVASRRPARKLTASDKKRQADIDRQYEIAAMLD